MAWHCLIWPLLGLLHLSLLPSPVRAGPGLRSCLFGRTTSRAEKDGGKSEKWEKMRMDGGDPCGDGVQKGADLRGEAESSKRKSRELRGRGKADHVQHGLEAGIIQLALGEEQSRLELCQPSAIRALAAEEEEGEEASGGSSTDTKAKKAPMTGSKGGGEPSKWSRKSAIRLGLRKYLCDFLGNKMAIEGWQHSGSKKKLAQLLRIGKEEVEVERFQRHFKSGKEHQLGVDFKFTVFYPMEFKELWSTFGRSIPEELLISLTKDKLKGFNIDSKGGCQLFNSWDSRFFLKSVRMKPKRTFPYIKGLRKMLEPIVEKDFFFKHLVNGGEAGKEDSFWEWSQEERSAEKDCCRLYRGGFLDYLRHIIDPNLESLLPKYFLLFHLEQDPVAGHQPERKEEEPMLFTIQNGLFPESISQIKYKFDLKGSTTERFSRKAAERSAKGEEPNLKDRNFIYFQRNGKRGGLFPDGIHLSVEQHEHFKAMVQRDSQFLADLSIIDYSLLMGVLVEPADGQSLKGGIPAYSTAKMEGLPDLYIFVGIIDILQPYIPRKVFESELKTVTHLFRSRHPQPVMAQYKQMSVIEPEAYKRRFEDFLTKLVLVTGKEEEEGGASSTAQRGGYSRRSFLSSIKWHLSKA